MRIDLHVHFIAETPCSKGRMTAADAITAGIKSGLDGMALLDHGHHTSRKEISDALASIPLADKKIVDRFVVFRATELTILGPNGVNNDLVVLSDEDFPFPAPKKVDISILPQLKEFCKAVGGFTIWAHPFRKGRMDHIFNYTNLRPDGIELSSKNTPKDDKSRAEILSLLNQWKCLPISSSDAHRTSSLGGFYTEVEGHPRNVRELFATIGQKPYSLFETCTRKFCTVEKEN